MEPEQQTPVPSITPEQLEAERQQRLNAERTAMQAIAYAQGLQQQIPQPQTYEQDLWADDPKQLAAQVEARAVERAQQISQATLAPVVQTYVANQRAMNDRLAETDPTMPHFKEWKKDIDFVLGSVDPSLAVKPEALQAAYKIVSSFHPEVLVEDELKKRRLIEDAEPEEEQQQVYTRDDTEMPVSSARGPTPARSPAKVKLTREEQSWAARFDATPEEFRYYQENDSEDIFGFKGRRRV